MASSAGRPEGRPRAASANTSLGRQPPAPYRAAASAVGVPLHRLAAARSGSASTPALACAGCLGGPRAERALAATPFSEAQRIRWKATESMLAQHNAQAVEQLNDALDISGEGLPGHLETLRLRCMALLRSKRNSEALRDTQAAVKLLPRVRSSTDTSPVEEAPNGGDLGEPPPSLSLQANIWQLRGIACARCSRPDEAAASFANALQLRVFVEQRRRTTVETRAVLEYFLENAAKASAATLPIDLYTHPLDAAPGSPATSTPAYVLQLRPRFSVWPLEFCAPIATEPGLAEILRSTRIAMYCAGVGIPTEPHLCLVHKPAEVEGLVLLNLRIDGMIEVISNSTEAAQQLVRTVFIDHVRERSMNDFEVLCSGWQREGRAVRAFEALAVERRQDWAEWRASKVRQRYEERHKREQGRVELLRWTTELGLAECGEILAEEGVDLETLQHL